MAYKDKDKERAAKRKHYHQNKEQYYRRNNRKNQELREYLLSEKEKGCSLCGERCIPCLEFHHVDPESKDMSVSQMINYGNLNRLKEEMSKCVLLCANCHRKVHHGIIELDTRVSAAGSHSVSKTD